MRFEADDLSALAETEEIVIETRRPGGPSHRTIIWVVVDGEEAFVRSVNGPTARWYREAMDDPRVTVHLDGRALTATVEAAGDPASVRRTSEALERKYAGDPSTPSMLEPDTLETTLRLRPG